MSRGTEVAARGLGWPSWIGCVLVEWTGRTTAATTGPRGCGTGKLWALPLGGGVVSTIAGAIPGGAGSWSRAARSSATGTTAAGAINGGMGEGGWDGGASVVTA